MANGEMLYRRMGLALENCGREILFSACNWGVDGVHGWARSTGASMFRSTGDIFDNFKSFSDIAFSQIDKFCYSAPGCFNDIDMLTVGMFGKGNVGNTGCDLNDYINYVGIDASLRGTWHMSRLVGLFVEPRLLAYSSSYMPTSLSTTGVDLLANVNVGLQFNMDGSGRSAAGDVQDNSDWRRGSFTLAGGLTNRVGQLKVWEKYSPIGRLSYTQWFSPYAAWRASLQGMVTRKEGLTRYAQAHVGGDILVDLTSYTYGFDASRPLSVRALAGVNLGADYGKHHATFAPDVHVGGQLAVRLTDRVHLVAEPQLACNLSSRFTTRRRQRIMPQLLVGLDYNIQRSSANGGLREAPQHPNVLSLGMGTGVSSENFGDRRGFGPRLSYVVDMSYGRWIDGVNGVQGGLSNSVIQRRGKGNENLTSIHAGYMMNIKSAVTGENTDSHTFQLTGIAAASLNIASWENHDTKVAPGLMGAIQAGVRVSPTVELYLEPSATLLSKNIAITPKNHPIESELKLTIGTKVRF